MNQNAARALIATSKGLIVLSKTEEGWTFQHDEFLGMPASLVYVDPRDGAWWISLAHKHWGQKLHRSRNGGESWENITPPKYPEGKEMKPDVQAQLRYVWAFSHGGYDKPERFFIGTEPGGLFVTEDDGKTFDLVESLWNHPSREKHWFGGGRDYAGIHTVVLDPNNSSHIYIGVSCAGVFETWDDGKNWSPKNKGLRADYLPDPYVEVGHDPHMMYICQAQPNVIWQQNHCGVFRSINAGQSWTDVTSQNELGRYGFALAIDHQNPDRAWIIPAQSDEMRIAVDKKLVVCSTSDGGKSWQEHRTGLPQENCYDIVFRHALAYNGATLIFGTTNGSIYISEDDGRSWQCLGNHFPKVHAVVFA